MATPIQPDFDRFQALAAEGNCVPVCVEMTSDYETPVSAFTKLATGGPNAFLLESAEKVGEIGRYSFVGIDPRFVLRAKGQNVSLTDSLGKTEQLHADDPMQVLQDLMAAYRPSVDPSLDLPVFYGGAVGFLGYDAVRYFEPSVSVPCADPLDLPDMCFFLADSVLIFDHQLRRLRIVINVILDDGDDLGKKYANARAAIEKIIERLRGPMSPPPFFPGIDAPDLHARSNTSKEEFLEMVMRAKDYIAAGDVFQVVPSQRFEVEYAGSPIAFYRALRAINPSPYMFCLQFAEGFALVGCSPEVHVRVIDGKISIRPIAGTRWRGKTREEDDALAIDLRSDAKECAEHLMLVDLARNDLGRVAQFESVTVDDFMIIERYSHVMHLVSNVSGMLLPEMNAFDLMRATFPAGTVSGAPKIRAMQIISEVEKSRRGAYSGAVGYFGFDGNHDSCIALRTGVLKEGKIFVQAGAGVVADSDPEYEWNETVNKAAALIRAVSLANESQPKIKH